MIYPSILTDSLDTAQRQLDLVAGKVPVVQLDYIDAVFADEVTLSPAEAAELNFHKLKVDLHIQTNDPIEELNEVLRLSPVLRTVVAQVERMPSQRAFVDAIKANNWKVGLSLDLFTPVVAIDDDIWQDLDMVQIMGIYAGRQQQTFQAPALRKVAEAHELIRARNLKTELVVDGGINPQIAAECRAVGADSFAVGSYLWNSTELAVSLFSLQ